MRRFVNGICLHGAAALFIGLILSLPVLAAEPDAAVSFSTRQLPPWAETAWSQYRTQRASGSLKEASETLARIRKQADDQGIEGFDLPAAVMIQEGEEALAKGRLDEAVELGRAARQWSPNDPNSAFYLAKALFHQHPFRPFAALGHYADGISAAVRDFWFSFYILGRLMMILLAGLLGSFVVFFVFLLIRYLPLLVHGLHEWIGAVLTQLAVWVLVSILLLLPLFIGAGTGFVLLVGLGLVWRFMTRNERLLSAAFVAVVSLAIFWLPIALSWFTADRSTELMLLSQVAHGEAAATGSASRIMNEGGFDRSWPVLLSLALQEKREGNYVEALERYKALQKREPDRPIILNNMGNVYFMMKRYDEAMADYKLSLAKNPQDAASHYNLNLVYRELLRFNDAKQEYETAQQINLPLIQSHKGEGPMDELFPMMILWKTALSDSPLKEAYSGELFKKVLMPLTLDRSPYLLPFLGVGLIVMRLAVTRKYAATHCSLCGRPICFHCQRRLFDIKTCAVCWSGSKHIKRKKDLRQIKIRHRSLLRKARWISVFSPGAGHLYFGRGLKGFVFQAVFIGILFAFFFKNGFSRAPTEQGEIVGFGSWVLILSGLVVLYLWVFLDILKLSYEKA